MEMDSNAPTAEEVSSPACLVQGQSIAQGIIQSIIDEVADGRELNEGNSDLIYDSSSLKGACDVFGNFSRSQLGVVLGGVASPLASNENDGLEYRSNAKDAGQQNKTGGDVDVYSKSIPVTKSFPREEVFIHWVYQTDVHVPRSTKRITKWYLSDRLGPCSCSRLQGGF